MASNINPFNIDGTYPVAGQDNDSQGFRDNFTNTATNFSIAATELTDLQSKVLLKSALTGQSLNNNMGGASIAAVNLNGAGYNINNQGTLTGAVTLDFSTGNVQKVTTGAPISLTFANWPTTGVFGEILLWVHISNVSHTVTVNTTAPGVTVGLADVAGAIPSSGVITFDTTGDFFLSFSTIDGGQNIVINDVNRNSATFRDPNFYFNDNISSTFFVGYDTNLPVALASDSGQNRVSIYGSVVSTSVGNLTLANLRNNQLDTGTLAGYTITSARGNLATATIAPVNSNDYLGYVNAVTFTGNGAGNVFQQLSSIDFYATGSNVTYGLGGNIAFFTGKDGDVALQHTVYQAVGIENDQSTHMFGNVLLSATATSGGTSSYVPATSGAKGTAGQIAWDQTYFYVCTATNTWKRVALNVTSW